LAGIPVTVARKCSAPDGIGAADDLSQAALDLASKNVESLACPATLEHRDFVAALRDRPEPADVTWIGFSLHHLLGPAKLEFMREVRSVVGDRGLFLI
jgi:hypothetical protein